LEIGIIPLTEISADKSCKSSEKAQNHQKKPNIDEMIQLDHIYRRESIKTDSVERNGAWIPQKQLGSIQE
jgi:hypothetical protein